MRIETILFAYVILILSFGSVQESEFIELPTVGYGRAEAIAWNPNGTQLAISTRSKTGDIWIHNLTTHEIKKLETDKGFITVLAWHPSDTLLAGWDSQKGIIVWDTNEAEIKMTYETSHQVIDLTWSPDGSFLKANFADTENISVWNILTDELESAWQGFDIAWSPDGKLMVISDDKSIYIRDLWSSEVIKSIEVGIPAEKLTWSLDGKYIALPVEKDILIWKPFDGEELRLLENGHNNEVTKLLWGSDDYLISSDYEGKFNVWNVDDGTIQFPVEGQGFSDAAAVNMIDNTFAIIGRDGSIVIWDIETESYFDVIPQYGENFRLISWDSTGTFLASAGRGEDYWIRIWDAFTGELESVVENDDYIFDFAWSPNGNFIAASLDGGVVKIWNTASSQVVLTLSAENGIESSAIQTIAWSPDGHLLVGVSEEATYLWDANSGQLLKHWNEVGFGNLDVDWHPESKRFVLAKGGTVKIVDVTEKYPILELSAECEWQTEMVDCLFNLTDVAWSLDGRYIATAGPFAVVWNAETGKPVSRLEGRIVAWRPNGTQLALVLYENTVEIWNIDTWDRANTLQTQLEWIETLSWSPDGSQIAVNDALEAQIHIWEYKD